MLCAATSASNHSRRVLMTVNDGHLQRLEPMLNFENSAHGRLQCGRSVYVTLFESGNPCHSMGLCPPTGGGSLVHSHSCAQGSSQTWVLDTIRDWLVASANHDNAPGSSRWWTFEEASRPVWPMLEVRPAVASTRADRGQVAGEPDLLRRDREPRRATKNDPRMHHKLRTAKCNSQWRTSLWSCVGRFALSVTFRCHLRRRFVR